MKDPCSGSIIMKDTTRCNHEYEDAETGTLLMDKIASSFSEFLNLLYLDE